MRGRNQVLHVFAVDVFTVPLCHAFATFHSIEDSIHFETEKDYLNCKSDSN